MHVLITGAAGFIGRKLVRQLLSRGSLSGADGFEREIERLTAFDVVAPPDGTFDDPRIALSGGDLSEPGVLEGLVAGAPDVVFHLASVVSAGAEADFDLGYGVNLDGTRRLLEGLRHGATKARLVFTSSVAVYGGEIGEVVDDDTRLTPQTSYGAQKAMLELLIADYSRKGYLDGRSVRLPTVVVRPGKPNLAASGFASGIIREPLNGIDFRCPVRPESAMAVISPRRVVDALVQLNEIDGEALGAGRALLLPGLRVSQAEAVDSLRRVAAGRKIGAVSFQIDDEIQAIVDGWPRESRSAMSARLGFQGDQAMDDIVRAYIEDELPA